VERALSGVLRRGPRTALVALAMTTTAMAFLPRVVLHAQVDTTRTRPAVPAQRRDRSAYELAIPFVVGPTNCVDHARLYSVTMRIYNVLAQAVGSPTLGSSPADSTRPVGAGPRLRNLRLPCGQYVAHWNGRHIDTGRRLAPGVYLSELVIDGQRVTRKVTLGR
jgi:hypothetical protein